MSVCERHGRARGGPHRHHKSAGEDEARIAASLEAWTAKMPILEAQLAQTEAYVVGDEITLADIALGLSVHR